VSVATLAASFSALELFEAMAPRVLELFDSQNAKRLGEQMLCTLYGTLYEYLRLCGNVLYHASLFEPSFDW
jgi:hypothetical protein